MNSANFGLPQRRHRVWMVFVHATRGDATEAAKLMKSMMMPAPHIKHYLAPAADRVQESRSSGGGQALGRQKWWRTQGF